MIIINKSIKRRIKFAIRDKEITHGELAAEMKISPSYLERKLNGYEAIEENMVKQICEILEVDISWALNGGEYEPDMPENTVGERITKQIFKRWLTKKEFAEYAGIDVSTLSNWCNNKNMPNSDMIIYLHDVFQVSTDYLLLGKI